MTSWNFSSFSTIAGTSFELMASLNSTPAVISFFLPSSVILSHARPTESSSSAILTSSASLRSLTVILATSAPFLGIITTSPSSSSILIASLTGVLLTPRFAAIFSSMRRSPGWNSPLIMAFLRVLNTTSRRGRNSFGSISSFMFRSYDIFRIVYKNTPSFVATYAFISILIHYSIAI